MRTNVANLNLYATLGSRTQQTAVSNFLSTSPPPGMYSWFNITRGVQLQYEVDKKIHSKDTNTALYSRT